MDKVIDLLKKSGVDTGGGRWVYDEFEVNSDQLEKFYTLARADLEAEMQEQCRINGMGAERELKLMAQRLKLLDALDTAITVIEEYQAASIRQGFLSPEIKKLREARGRNDSIRI